MKYAVEVIGLFVALLYASMVALQASGFMAALLLIGPLVLLFLISGLVARLISKGNIYAFVVLYWLISAVIFFSAIYLDRLDKSGSGYVKNGEIWFFVICIVFLTIIEVIYYHKQR